jgi:hypothetical protein
MDEREVGRRGVIGAVSAGIGAVAVATVLTPTEVWASPTIRAAVGLPTVAASAPPTRELFVTVVGGERRADGWRRVTLFVGYVDDSTAAGGARVFGQSLIVPEFQYVTWRSSPSAGAPAFALSGKDGAVTLYAVPVPAGGEFANLGFYAVIQKSDPDSTGQVFLEGNEVPTFLNGPAVGLS